MGSQLRFCRGRDRPKVSSSVAQHTAPGPGCGRSLADRGTPILPWLLKPFDQHACTPSKKKKKKKKKTYGHMSTKMKGRSRAHQYHRALRGDAT
jgi:hypothetical protein